MSLLTRPEQHFNPRSPCGERPRCYAFPRSRGNFNPRSPCGERLWTPRRWRASATSISTHAPLAGSDVPAEHGVRVGMISTHAPLAGSDIAPGIAIPAPRDFNPRSPCGERPLSLCLGGHEVEDFNPRSPCGERPPRSPDGRVGVRISTHAPLAGSDGPVPDGEVDWRYFNPRSPCGERPTSTRCSGLTARNFNPRSPCGERRAVHRPHEARMGHFNPRSPCGERQPVPRRHGLGLYDFNPRSPCGERLDVVGQVFGDHPVISTHAPLAGSDRLLCKRATPIQISTHAPLAGSDCDNPNVTDAEIFQPTLPLRGATGRQDRHC